MDLSNYYTKDETWSAIRIIEDQLRQDRAVIALVDSARESILLAAEGMMTIKVTNNNMVLNNSIEQARREAMGYTDLMIAGVRDDKVPNTRRVNGWPLIDDVTLGALDIEFRDGVTVWQKLSQLEHVINFRHIVERYDDLPPPVQNNDGAIIRYGPQTGGAEMWVVIQAEWTFAASFAVNMDTWPTRVEVQNMVNAESQRAMSVEEALWNALSVEAERSLLFDNMIEARLLQETNRSTAADAQLSADIISMGNNTLTQANNHADLLFQSIQGIFDNKVDRTFQPPLITGISTAQNNDNAWLTIYRISLDGIIAAPIQSMFPQVSDDNVGMMTPSAYRRIWEMSDWIDNFQIGGTYIGSFATRAALNSSPTQIWWVPNDWAIVQADETQLDQFGQPQTTRYILNASLVWTFANTFGGNMPGLFSNTRAGIIRGTSAGDGTIGILDPYTGTAQVNGWANLVNQVTNIRSVIGVDADGNFQDPATGMNLRVNRNQAAIADVNAGLSASNARIVSLESNIGTGPDGLFVNPPAGLNARVTNNTTDITANRNNINALLARAASIEGVIGINSDGGFITPAAGMNGRIDNVAADVTTLNTRIGTVEGSIQGLDGRITENAGNIAGNATAITTANANIDSQRNRLDILEDEVAGIPRLADLGVQSTPRFGQSVQNGIAITVARSDHFHALPDFPSAERIAITAVWTVPTPALPSP